MKGRVAPIVSAASFVFALGLTVFAVSTFFHIATLRPSHPNGWEIIIRGGVIRIDNQLFVSRQYAAAVAENNRRRAAWEAPHDQLRFAMEGAAYGPAYTAARLKLDAWEQEHGIQWKLRTPASSPVVEYRIQIIWLILLAALLALLTRRDTSVLINRARFAFRIAAVLGCLAIAVLWMLSYRQVTFFSVYTADSTYSVALNRGRASIGLPEKTNPMKLAQVRRLAALISNDQVQWTVGPMNFGAMAPRPGARPNNGPGIYAYFAPDTPLAQLQEDRDATEVSTALLEALHDPDRYLAAHVLLSINQHVGIFYYTGGYKPYYMTTSARYAFSRFNDLNITLTPEQQAAKVDTPMPNPNIVPGQIAAIEAKWHKAFDIQAKPISLGYLASLLLLPACWIFFTIRRRYRLPPNHCRCGYNLTGNISGICPECGRAVSPAVAASTVANRGAAA